MAAVVTGLGLWEPEPGSLPSTAHQDARGQGPQSVWECPVSAGGESFQPPGAQRASRKTVSDKAGALAFRALLLTLALPAPTQEPGAGDSGDWRLEGAQTFHVQVQLTGGKGVPWGAGPCPTHTSHVAPVFPPRPMGATDPYLAIKGLLTAAA